MKYHGYRVNNYARKAGGGTRAVITVVLRVFSWTLWHLGFRRSYQENAVCFSYVCLLSPIPQELVDRINSP